MKKHEFEQLAGYAVSSEDFEKVIEPMFKATTLSERDFVKCLDKKRFALSEKQLRNEMAIEARHLMETGDTYKDFDSWDRIDDLAREYTKRFSKGDDWYFREKHTGDWFWGAEGRGANFPVSLVIDDLNFQTVQEVEILNFDREMKRLAKEAC